MIADAGFLLALERNQRTAWARFSEALGRHGDLIVPATVLAQTWRGGTGRQYHLAAALAAAQILPLDEVAAKVVGNLLAAHEGSDIADGQVAALAAAHPTRPVASSDRRDLDALGVNPHRIMDV